MHNKLHLLLQSQPCHWRNVKNVRKRSVDSQIKPNSSTLSENVNLFQSLRVLQDGENDEQRNITATSRYQTSELDYF